MDGELFTERGDESVIRRKEQELIAEGYEKAEGAHPFRLRVWEYTIQPSPASRNNPMNPSTKHIISWMKPDKE